MLLEGGGRAFERVLGRGVWKSGERGHEAYEILDVGREYSTVLIYFCHFFFFSSLSFFFFLGGLDRSWGFAGF